MLVKNENILILMSVKYFIWQLTCKVDNLLMLDIGEKNEGSEEWAEYLTHTVAFNSKKTPNNVYHSIFNEMNDLYTEKEDILIKWLKNKAGYRNKSIDIRKGNGYILCEPFTIGNKKYEFVRNYGDNNIFLILEKKEYTDNNDSKTLLIIMTTEDELNLILHKLTEYVVNP